MTAAQERSPTAVLHGENRSLATSTNSEQRVWCHGGIGIE